MSSKANPNQLIVEAYDDLGAVIGLMRHHMNWPVDSRPVNIRIAKSAVEALKSDFLSPLLKQSGLHALGLIVDADEVFTSRWDCARRFCETHFDNVPLSMPSDGLILENNEGVRFGVWIMPDNQASGMLETFCNQLVPDTEIDSWNFAQEAIETARGKGMKWRNCHQEKAKIHTWLAWQDPPGERIGIAITKKMLDPHSDKAQGFVKWFKRLYQF